jgi:urease alpha subunit
MMSSDSRRWGASRRDLPHLADRRQDEAAAHSAAGVYGERQPSRCRYIAKYDQPGDRAGIAPHVGSLEVGKMATSSVAAGVLRRQAGLVIKGSFIAGAMMGDGNASVPTRSRWSRGRCSAPMAPRSRRSVHFVSQAGIGGRRSPAWRVRSRPCAALRPGSGIS